MSTITTIGANDKPSDSRTDINNNFSNLNTDKLEITDANTDGTFTANSDTEFPTQKAVKTYVDNASRAVDVESTSGTTHSLTTTAGQEVWVVAKGNLADTNSTSTIELKYNGVQKDLVYAVNYDSTPAEVPFCLQYIETPGADTQDITVTTNNGIVENVVIVVQKIG